jgi:hypothetical protein
MSHDLSSIERKIQHCLADLNNPKKGSIWKHYKGNKYVMTGYIIKESTEEVEVCYVDLDNPLPCSWSRPLSEWNDDIEYNGKVMKRFIKV